MGILYAIARPIADAIVDAVFDRLFEPKKVVIEQEGANDELVPSAAAKSMLRWLHEQNKDDPERDYAPHDQPMEPRPRGYETTRRDVR